MPFEISTALLRTIRRQCKAKLTLAMVTAAALAVGGAGWAGSKGNSGQIPNGRIESKPEAQAKERRRSMESSQTVIVARR